MMIFSQPDQIGDAGFRIAPFGATMPLAGAALLIVLLITLYLNWLSPGLTPDELLSLTAAFP